MTIDANKSHDMSQETAPVRSLEKTGKFGDIKETRSEARFVTNCVVVEDELCISLFKKREALNISLKRPKFAQRRSSLKDKDI